MNKHKIPRQPTASPYFKEEKNSCQTIIPCRRQEISPIESTLTHMSITLSTTPTDWKLRYETLQNQHQLELERVRHHYEHQLKEKVTEIRTQLKHEYEQQLSEFQARLFEQQRQQLHNLSSSSLGLDQSIGDQVREQIRLAQENDRKDEELRQCLLKQSTNSDELKQIINKLHNEGIHVLTLSERLALQLNGININTKEVSLDSLQKLDEENSFLRSFIANMNANETADKLIKSLADVFRCEQERRIIQSRQHPNSDKLEQDIHAMCNYQRDALAKFFSQDGHLLNNEFNKSKRVQNQSISNKFYFKYIRSENYRKALIYQKRYLLVLLTGYADTETYALNEIRRLTGDMKQNSYPYQSKYDKMKLIPKQPYHKHLYNYRFRFRYYVRVVIAIIRMRCFAKKWTQKLASGK
ncbi:unnamed protein product [Adineta steineri]|uniref:Pericentrin/AKAP-450 centrosomal targeting domain-containing protein n=1 Tax=Adineta steineri TaxID=433720 RepID=A0A815L931_9BILA|nr:unnamed protein product [Adineta steineri]CAF3604132.1 unnamed protein product [Adineta steineri]